MFYVRERVNGSLEIRAEISDENVFCRCPVCGAEVPVNLEDVLGDGMGDLFGTAVLCSQCTGKVMDRCHGNES